MELFQSLRVLVTGQQNNFYHVLSTNVQHCGYDVTCCSADALWQEEMQKGKQAANTLAKWQADVLLYDLDDVVDVSRFHTSAGELPTFRDREQFLIALSSRSISINHFILNNYLRPSSKYV